MLFRSALPPEMSWAAPSPTISRAFAGWAALVDQTVQDLLSPQVRQLVTDVLRAWQGEPPGLSQAWVNRVIAGFTGADRASAKLALLTALAPYQVDEEIIRAVRQYHASDAYLVGVVAWAAFEAARKVASWLQPTTERKEVGRA